MSDSALIDSLNKEQKDCVTAPLSNMLIMAGAGTGKTRVLVTRIAYLIDILHVKPSQILALTFTNKAANELKERVQSTVRHASLKSLWVGNFHSISLRILRNYHIAAKLDSNFLVLGKADSERIVKNLMNEIDETYFNDNKIKASEILNKISFFKEQGMRYKEAFALYKDAAALYYKNILKVYKAYERYCNDNNLVDFSELILRTVELLQNDDEIRQRINDRFKEILVDEFQDTSTLQYKLIRLLCGDNSHVTLVGDNDQTIYGWRGADVENARRFVKEYKDVAVKKLVLNYRSSDEILSIANTIIGGLEDRFLEKNLEGVKGTRSKVLIAQAYDAIDEANFVASSIADRLVPKLDVKLSDIAILYRNNSQSRLIEQALMQRKIRYMVYGGLRFFEREEVQNVLAYLRLVVNAKDDSALLRIINVPARKIGPSTIDKLKVVQKERNISLYEACALVSSFYDNKDKDLKALVTLAKKIKPFYDLIDDFAQKLQSGDDIAQTVSAFIKASGIYEYYEKKDDEKGASSDNVRHKNLDELCNYINEFIKNQYNTNIEDYTNEDGSIISPLMALISNICLVATGDIDTNGRESLGDDKGCVTLMTIHSSKGLEFKNVFIVGFEATILPMQRHNDETDDTQRLKRLQEERRLAYVATTRAKDRLYLTYATKRLAFSAGGMSEYTTGESEYLTSIRKAFLKYSDDKKPYVKVAVQK